MDILHRRERQKANRAAAQQRDKAYVASYLATHPCVDCGESDPIVLTVDHLPGGDKKRANVADMVHQGLAIETSATEISKCDVVCFNCHSLREQARRGAYRFRMEKTGKVL